jgi:hypothetical protein
VKEVEGGSNEKMEEQVMMEMLIEVKSYHSQHELWYPKFRNDHVDLN